MENINLKGLKGVIYARESTDDTNKAPPIEEQLQRAEQFADEQGIILVRNYIDDGYSGGNWKRPEWNQLIKDAKFHKFNLVIVFNTDRIARDVEQFLFFNRNLKEAYCQVFSITEGMINLESVGDTAKNVSIAMANEIFRKITSEKVSKAYEMKKRNAEKKGEKVTWGRKKTNYDVMQIMQLKAQGLGLRRIAKEVGCSYQTINRVLQNTHSNKTEINEGENEK